VYQAVALFRVNKVQEENRTVSTNSVTMFPSVVTDALARFGILMRVTIKTALSCDVVV
jgi:hypothetical protein